MARIGIDRRTNWQKFKDFLFKTYDETENFNVEDIENTAMFAPIGYLGILFFVPLLIFPKSPFVKFHANQGLILLIATLLGNIAIIVLGWLFNFIGLWFLTMLFFTLFNLCAIGFIAIGANNAMSGTAKELPAVGRFRIIK